MFTFFGFIRRNLAYHWPGNLAVVLGVAVGSAVLTGALLVGDSLRGSLRARVERQLGGYEAVALFQQPIPVEVAYCMPGRTVPMLLRPGSIQVVSDDPTAPSLGQVTLLGINNLFRSSDLSDQPVDWDGSGKQVVISARIAAKLGLSAGDSIRVSVERLSDIPRSSSLSKRDSSDVNATDTFIVKAVLPPEAMGNDFNLTPNPNAPLNIFMPIEALSRLMSGTSAPKINTILSTNWAIADLNTALRTCLRPEDYGLKFREIDRCGYLSVESSSLILPEGMVASICNSAKTIGCRAEPTVVYVADTLAAGNKEIAYPVIAGLNASAEEPLGPFLPKGVSELVENDIVLLDWNGSPLNGLPTGTKIQLKYFDPDVEGEGVLKSAELVLRGYIALSGAARDRDLTPEVRGVTDVRAELRDLDRPPVLPREKIRQRVPDKDPRAQFFNTNKATPMAYVNLATGEKLFGSRFGSVTSVRVAPKPNQSLEETKERLRSDLRKHLDPASAGLVFQPIREQFLTASNGGTDFGGLFLGFSLFLIVAALMLVGLLFRLTLDRRAKEIGLLLATGYAVRAIRRLLLAEGLVLAVIGACLGLVIGIGYNQLLIFVLVELWPDPEVGTILHPHFTSESFILGFCLTLAMSLLALWSSVRGLVKVSPPALLRGETILPTAVVNDRARFSVWLAVILLPLGIVAIVAGKFITNPDLQAMTFFSGGGLLLTAGLALAWVWMKRTRHAVVNGRGWQALAGLGSRNAARNPTRSLLTMALLASAAFLLVAVESFRREPGNDFLDKSGGSGGFNLIAETDVPLFQSFESGPGRADLDRQLLEAFAGNSQDPRYQNARAELDGIEVYPLRYRAGDDASCLNLFQAARPRILGVPDRLIERGGFKFYETEAATPEEHGNPWLLLKKPLPDGVLPVFCEQNTAEWMLKKAVGDDIKMTGDDGRELTLRIVGTFADSPFQSELLMSDAAFTQAFPTTSGYRVFLIHTPPGKEAAVARVLATGFRASGLMATSTRERVATYQAVIGAYLSTFQLLGGLGLLLGVMGLAVVVLRSVWERAGELALLRAVGYGSWDLQLLVLAENAVLLLIGLGIGVLAALASVAPHVAEGARVPWARLSELLALVVAVGLVVAFTATAGILRVPVIPALRRE